MNYLDLLVNKYPVRNSKEQKNAFREFAVNEAKNLGYEAKTEITSDKKNENVIVGDPEKAKLVFCAHFDTPFTSLFPNLMIVRNKFLFYLYQFIPVIIILLCSYIPASLIANNFFKGDMNILAFEIYFFALYFGLFYLLYFAKKNKNNHNDNTSGTSVLFSLMEKLSPEEREKAAFIFFDNEEKGKLGSKAYLKDHKDFMENKTVINFDCVGNGKNIVFVAMKEAENIAEYSLLKECVTPADDYKVHFYGQKGSECNSDHKNFKKGIAVMACKETKKGLLYTPNIHTEKDVEADFNNIDFISNGIVNFISKL